MLTCRVARQEKQGVEEEMQEDDIALRAAWVRARRRRPPVGSDERGIYVVEYVGPDLADACTCIR